MCTPIFPKTGSCLGLHCYGDFRNFAVSKLAFRSVCMLTTIVTAQPI